MGMDKRKYVAMTLAEEMRGSSRPRYNNNPPSQALNTTDNSMSSTNSKPFARPTNPAPIPMSKPNAPVATNIPDQTVNVNNTKEDPFKQVQGDELDDEDEDEDEDGAAPAKRPANAKRAGRRKIKIEYIQEKSRRHITFSKRKSGIMKKAFELSTLTGTQVLLLVVSETGLVYTFTTPKLQPIVTKEAGRNLIQACLHSADPAPTNGDEDGAQDGADGEHSNEDDGGEDDDNDEPQQEDQQVQDEEEEGSEQEQEQKQEGAQGIDNGDGGQGNTTKGTMDHPPSSPTTTRPSASGPPQQQQQQQQPAGQNYPPRYLPHHHPGPLMYPPPYSHIPYPVSTSAEGQQPGGVAGREVAGRTYWQHPHYPEYGYPPYYPSPPPHPHSYPQHPQHPHHPQQQQHAKNIVGVSSGPDSKAMQKEE